MQGMPPLDEDDDVAEDAEEDDDVDDDDDDDVPPPLPGVPLDELELVAVSPPAPPVALPGSN